ncbi:hypothetical protein [Burkholderia gladioli]|nr:hypothetical protein [Burkholderia gladioli]
MKDDKGEKVLPLPVICFIALVAMLAWSGLHPDAQQPVACRPHAAGRG